MNIAFDPATPKAYVEPLLPSGETWDDVARQGGLWLDEKTEAAPVKPRGERLQWSDPVLSGAPDRFPLQFQPYLSLQYHDGRAANLPWMQELPDPVSSSMWDIPLEIDPQTAAKLESLPAIGCEWNRTAEILKFWPTCILPRFLEL